MSRARIAYGLAATLVATSIAPALAGDPSPAQIDAVFADFDNTNSPGCALGVMRDGELIYKRGYGMANLEYGIALSPRSVFRTGSVGKQFTAMAIAILAEQGVISLDRSLRELFPEFPDWATDITIRHLIHHSSGLRDYLTLGDLAGFGESDRYTDEFAIELLARQMSLNFPPGARYLYSNSGYFLLSHVVARATGLTLREWAAENMFVPLGMLNTHYQDDHTRIVPNRAAGHATTDNGFRLSMTTLDMVGDGGVFTTVEDLLLWDRNFYDNKLGEGGPRLIELVTTPGRLEDGERQDYAFGLRISQYRGLEMIAHGGAFVGFRADMIRFPTQRFSVAVLCNRADAEPGGMAREVATLYLADVMDTDRDPATADSGGIRWVEVPHAELTAVAGHFWNPERRVVRQVELDEGSLYLVFSRNDRFELVPQGDRRFAVHDFRSPTEVSFEPLAAGGMRMSIMIEGDDEPRQLERFSRRQLAAGDSKDYAGRYYSQELDVEYVLEEEDESLVFGIDRPGEHDLEPQFGEVFTNSDYGTFEFRRGAGGNVVGFSLDAGRVRNLGFVRR